MDQAFKGFNRPCIRFLKELAANNNRDWFQENKDRYESAVRSPALDFIRAMQEPLRQISPHFDAVPKKVGGSLMRVYRDTRFSNDKTPYKTNIGIQFRHRFGKDVHTPGFYVHIQPGEHFIGIGIWRPDAKALTKIRDYMADNPNSWLKARDDKAFRSVFELAGESLQRPPRGYPKEHPLLEDLKRKDHLALARLKNSDIESGAFVELAAQLFKRSKPYMDYLCTALDVPF